MRKICVVVASRANYGRVKAVLKAIQCHPDLELQIVVGASMMLDRYGNAIDVLKSDGFTPNKSIYYMLEGESLETQAKSTGIGIIELSTAFKELQSNIVITVADRFETMATAIAASYLNIPLAHIQGGEITGNIDETVRHAITKLAHYHFPATEQSRQRILKMGEEEWRVLNVGCPSIDTLVHQDLSLKAFTEYCMTGVGHRININEPFILMIQHPVTTQSKDGYEQIMETLNALIKFPYQKLVLWPNIDAGSDKISKGIRVFRERNRELPFRYYKNFPPEIFNSLLANAVCVVGNSSSFIREGAYLGTPAVIVGDRQEGREHGMNVLQVSNNGREIEEALAMQIKHGKYKSEKIFGVGNAGILIANYLADVELNINKRMTY